MKTWILKFSSYKKPDDIFKFIVNGRKVIETRSRNPDDGADDYVNVKEGDILIFKSLDTNKEIEKEVIFNHIYNSVEDLVVNEDVKKILPSINSNEEFLKVIEDVKDRWGEKYRLEVEKYGMVAIGFK